MDASMISMLSTGFSAPSTLADGTSSFSGSGDVGLGEWGWGWDLFDENGKVVEPTPSKAYPDTAEGRRERLDDLGEEIAAARARLGAVR